MHTGKIWLGVLLFLIVLSNAALRAELPVSLTLSATVPDSIPAASLNKIVDYDDDGFTDLLFKTDDLLAVYSVRKSETLLYFEFKSDTCQRFYAFGYLDGDKAADICELVCLTSPVNYRIAAVPYLSSLLYMPLDTVTLYTFDTPEKFWGPTLVLYDSDHNGRDELFGWFQYSYPYSDSSWTLEMQEEYFFKHYFKYDLIDLSLEELTAFPLWLRESYDLFEDGQPVFVRFSHFGSYIFWDNYEYTGLAFQEYIDNTLSLEYRIYPTSGTCQESSYNENFTETATLAGRWIGDFLADSPRYEMLLLVYFLYVDGLCTYEQIQLRCLDLSAPDHLSTLWRVIVTDDQPFGKVFSDEQYPNQFFNLVNGHLYLHDAHTAAAIDSFTTEDLVGSWVTYRPLEVGAKPLVILRDVNTFNYYSIAASTDVTEPGSGDNLPVKFALRTPYPNPFNAELSVPVVLDKNGHLKVEVFNLLGQRVTTLVDGEAQPGEQVLHWDATGVSSGVYLIRAEFGEERATVKAVLLK